MGSSQSKAKASNANGKDDDNRGKATSPSQEKHNSADSKAPLTEHAANFALPRPLSLDRHASVYRDAHNLNSSHAVASYDNAIRVTSRRSTVIPIYGSSRNIEIHDIEGHSDVSRPPPPPRLRHLSELIDPEELAVDSHIRSPSGNLLAPEQFLVHPHRPRSIRERQEEIREKVRAASRLGVETENATDNEKRSVEVRNSKKRKKTGCFGCGRF